MENIISQLHWVWLTAAVVLAIIEVVAPHFGCVFAAGAALVSAVLAAVHVSWLWQVAAFGAALLFSLALLRPRLIAKLHAGAPGVPSRTGSLVGREGKVTSATDEATGLARASFEGADWAVNSLGAKLAAGDTVKAESADGIVLIVKKKT